MQIISDQFPPVLFNQADLIFHNLIQVFTYLF